MATTNPKGSKNNPYTMSEYESLANSGNWEGGYVQDDSGKVTYTMKEVTVTGYSCGSSGSGSGSGSFQFASYTSFSGDPSLDDDDNDDEYRNGGGSGGSGSSGGGSGSSGGGSGSSGGGSGSSGNSGTTEETNVENRGINTGRTFNIENTINFLMENSTPYYTKGINGHCARTVREAIEAGGLYTTGHPNSAFQYKNFLPTIGFMEILYNDHYVAQKGDIVVIPNMDGHPHGHIAIFTGEIWISDYKQVDMWGGKDYRTAKLCTIFRW